jgi:fructoselysine 6-kinase
MSASSSSRLELTEREALDLGRQCLEGGPQAVVLTRGDGALGMDAQGTVIQPALPTVVVDTLGAGDGFISGFLTSMLAGGTLKDAMTRGAGFAAQVCGWQGGFGHDAPWTGDAHKVRASTSR